MVTLFSILSELGDLEVKQEKGSKKIKATLHIEWKKWDRTAYIGESESLGGAIDQVIKKLFTDLQHRLAVTQSRVQKYDQMYRTTKYQLKKLGDWDRLFHPEYYKSIMLGDVEPLSENLAKCPSCYSELKEDGLCPNGCDQ